VSGIGTGWFGPLESLYYALSVVGCDRDAEGRYCVRGTIALGLGGQEVVVGADADYYVGGQPRGLAGLLNSTSYGLRNVTVIA